MELELVGKSRIRGGGFVMDEGGIRRDALHPDIRFRSVAARELLA